MAPQTPKLDDFEPTAAAPAPEVPEVQRHRAPEQEKGFDPQRGTGAAASQTQPEKILDDFAPVEARERVLKTPDGTDAKKVFDDFAPSKPADAAPERPPHAERAPVNDDFEPKPFGKEEPSSSRIEDMLGGSGSSHSSPDGDVPDRLDTQSADADAHGRAAAEPEVPADVRMALDHFDGRLAQDYLEDPDFRVSDQDRADFRDQFGSYTNGRTQDYEDVLPEMRAALEERYPREQYPEVHEITDEELLGLRLYTEQGYKIVNRAQRETDLFKFANAAQHADPMTRCVQSALNRLPKEEGWVRRNIGGHTPGSYEMYQQRFAPGKASVENAFSSSSDLSYNYIPDKGAPRVRMEIFSRTAADIDFLSGNRGESEYLFGARSYFLTREVETRIEEIDGEQMEVMYVKVEEILPSELTPEMLEQIGPRLSYTDDGGNVVPLANDLLAGRTP